MVSKRKRMSRDRTLETYVERLLAWEEPITAKKLEALAAEVGLSQEDLAAVRKQAQDHLSRGKNYVEFDCLEEAIEELTQAASLDPLNPEILQTLAAAYKGRYQKSKKSADKTAAITTAKRCLEVDPDDAIAAQLIASLETARKFPFKRMTGGLTTLLLVAGVFGSKPTIKLLFNGGQMDPPHKVNVELDIPVRELDLDSIYSDTPTTATETTTAADNTVTQPSAAGSQSPEIDIPIVFEQPGLTIEPRLSRLSNYEDSSFYKLQGVLLNSSDQEIDSLRLQVDYLDQDGNVLLSNSTMALDTHEGTMRPGDRHAFDLIQQISPEFAQLKLNVSTIDQLPAPDNYPAAPTIDYTWAQKNSSLKFELTSRQENFSTYSAGSGYF